jgi:hypothetical protein
VQPALPSAEAASDTQQTEPPLQHAGGGKKEKERQRKERQRQRKMDEAWEALQVAIEAMLDARCVSPLRLMRSALIGRCHPGGRVYSRVAVYVWLQRGELAVGRGGEGDGGGGEARGSQQREAVSAGGGGGPGLLRGVWEMSGAWWSLYT